MKRHVVLLLLMATILLAVTGFKINEGQPVAPPNCFGGFVYDRSHQPVSGVTVMLLFPEGFSETTQTNDQGEYWLCSPWGEWTPGNYLITTDCCEKWRYRAGDGYIRVDFIIPCACR